MRSPSGARVFRRTASIGGHQWQKQPPKIGLMTSCGRAYWPVALAEVPSLLAFAACGHSCPGSDLSMYCIEHAAPVKDPTPSFSEKTGLHVMNLHASVLSKYCTAHVAPVTALTSGFFVFYLPCLGSQAAIHAWHRKQTPVLQ